jgi:hypothetical protein
MTVPVLLMIFNRPGKTAESMEAIRQARPERFYIAADGPRGTTDEANCAEARRRAMLVDWPCELKTKFSDHNLGCREGPRSAISWFFEQEPEGIILEDDCVPSPSFFPYCAELLERYRNDDRIMSINGDNFQRDMGNYSRSYYFSNYFHGWGWASWARAWKLNDNTMHEYPRWVKNRRFDTISKLPGFSNYWKQEFDLVYGEGKLQAWDYVWMFSCWTKQGLSIVPRVNLVSNIGFDPEGTHCLRPNHPMANLPRSEIEFPLIHPDLIQANRKADDFVSNNVFKVARRV